MDKFNIDEYERDYAYDGNAAFDTLRDAVHDLYYAAVWHADRPVNEAELWANVRNAAHFAKGQSPEPVVKEVLNPPGPRYL